MKPKPILTTFNAPSHIRSKFDEVCHLDGKSRTQVLVQLMTDYVLIDGPQIVEKIRSIQSFHPDDTAPASDRWLVPSS